MKIIAEFCQNHNGSYSTLEKMVMNAKKSGATHGKIQNIFAKNLTFRPQFEQGLKIGNNILPVSSSSLNVSTLAGGDTKPKNIPAGNASNRKVK